MIVRVRLFAMLRERAGTGEVEVELPDGASVADALVALEDVAGGVECLLAVNRVYAAPGDLLSPGDELALIPPVSGGSEPHARVTTEALSIDELARLVSDPRAGAVVTFSGVTREVDQLVYEAYAEMAEPAMREIVAAAIGRHGLCAAAAEHRIGIVPLSQPSVVVAASSPHRGAAFDGAREIIDAIKATAPIWKLEVAAGERRWVEGTVPGAEGTLP